MDQNNQVHPQSPSEQRASVDAPMITEKKSNAVPSGAPSSQQQPPVSQKNKPNLIIIFGFVALIAIIIVVTMFVRSGANDARSGESLFSNGGDLSSSTSPAPTGHGGGTPQSTGGVPRVSSVDHVRGAENPKVIIIEYGDFECPFCKRYHPNLQSLLAANGNDVQIVFRHFPLTIHALSFEKAVASECAAELGGEEAFWEYHDMLFDRANVNGTGVSLADLPKYAEEIGIDKTQFSTCLNSGKYDARIQGDINTGTAAGVTGTPSSVIVAPDGSGTLLPGVIEFEQLQQITDFLVNEYEG